MTRRLRGIVVIAALAATAAGCAAGRAFRQGAAADKIGDVDQAVAYYRQALQAEPDNAQYKITLERAMLAASRVHLERAQDFESHDQLDAAISEYRLASEYDAGNRLAASKAATLEQTVRDRLEAARPRPAIEQAREAARLALAQPMLNPASREPLVVRFTNTALRDVLSAIGGMTGINVVYDQQVSNAPVTVALEGVTIEDALNQIMTMTQNAYKVLGDRSILVFPDNSQKHSQYDDQVVRTFYVSHADATQLVQLLSVIVRLPGLPIIPAIAVNEQNNTITVRGTKPVVDIIGRVIEQNDKPKAEVVFDVEILEVDRTRTKQYGLNLSQYAVGGIFSPESAPTTTTGSTTPSSPPFNLNTISNGVSTADFYLAVPTAVVKFLETDSHTRLVAKPQLRGAEGAKLTLNLGEQIPIVTTSYTPIATGGASVNPLNSFTYKDVGINLEITPRVTLEGDVLIDLMVENSSQGADVNVGGTAYPSFGSRKVTTQLRLRDGEANLLAGLLREDDSNNTSGVPGVARVPGLRAIFGGNDNTNKTTDIVILLTPHIVRSKEVTSDDLLPVYIGSLQNLGVGGAPPLIASQGGPDDPAINGSAPGGAAAPPAAQPANPAFPPNANGTITLPPGSSPVPGTVLVPPPAAARPAQPAAAAEPPPAPARDLTATAPPSDAVTTTGVGNATVALTAPPAMTAGGGPYTVPIMITNAARISTITLTLTFDPSLLRVRTVQEGSFMRTGGASVTFVQQAAEGRVDMTITRAADATGATGSGLLAAVLFDAVSAGSSQLTLSGLATGPGGTAMGLQFRPVGVRVQ